MRTVDWGLIWDIAKVWLWGVAFGATVGYYYAKRKFGRLTTQQRRSA